MKCPECANMIECRLSIETELDDRPIYIYYQWWECKSCGKKYYAILEESKVNIFDDTLEHTGYYAKAEDWEKSLKWARQCHNPKNTQCQCPVHQQIPPSEFSGKSAWYTRN